MSGEKSEILTNSDGRVFLGKFIFDIENNNLIDGSGAIVRLRRQSAEVLAYLAARSGMVVPKSELIQEIWPDTFVTDDSLGQCIADIRRALGDNDHKIIQTFPKKGYMLVPTKKRHASPPSGPALRPSSIAAFGLLVIVTALVYFVPRGPDTATAPALMPPEQPSVIVLPFENQTENAEIDYLAAGFGTSIRTQLSKFPQLFVIAGSTSVTFKNRPGTARGIGRELGVQYVLDGSINDLGNGLSVSAELIEAETERTLWAEQYDLSPEGALITQADLVQTIVSTLSVVVDQEELAAVRSRPTNSPRAYDLFLRAQAASAMLTREGRARAVELLNQAIEIDPNYLAAHFELSGRHLGLYRFGGADDPDEALRRARHHAERALEISRTDYRGHFRMGMLHLFADHNHELAYAAFQRALADNPNDADVLYNMGFLRSLMGEPAEAIAWNDKAKRINPRYPGWYNFNAAQSRFFVGDYREAETLARIGIAEYPKSLAPRRILIVTLVESGRLDEAKAEVADYLAINPEFRLSTFRNTPFQNQSDEDRYYGALRLVGIPD